MKKLLLAALVKTLDGIDWLTMTKKALVILETKIKAKSGVDIELEQYADDLLGALESLVETELGVSIDLNEDGK